MGRHGILRNFKKAGDFTCWDPVGFSARQKAKGLQPCWLSERGEATDGMGRFHTSSFADIYDEFKTGSSLKSPRFAAYSWVVCEVPAGCHGRGDGSVS